MPSGIIVAVLFLGLLSRLPKSDAQSCGSFGIGQTSCVLLTPFYNQYQWATCLTDDYIRRTSNQLHACRNSAPVCWYQCQLELNHLDQGPVYDNCKCSTTSTLPTTDPDTPTLDPSCFSPNALDCSWYRECLEARYPCSGTEDGYAIEYAERYCNLFIDNYNDFTQSGRSWVDGVRKCLQVALVPSLRPWITKNCAEIRADAFNSHPGCYLTPGSGAPSMCDLSCKDVWKVFYVVNVIGDALTSAPVETGLQMLRVMGGCLGTTNCIGIAGSIGVTSLTFAIPGLAIYRGPQLFSLITKIGRHIARSINLDSNGIGWFPYHDDDSNDNRNRRDVMTPRGMDSANDRLVLLLIDLKTLNVSNITKTLTDNPKNLDEIIISLSDAVSNRRLSQIPVTVNNTDVVFGVSSLGQCGDTFCSNSTNVTELATPESSSAGILKFASLPIMILLASLVSLL